MFEDPSSLVDEALGDRERERDRKVTLRFFKTNVGHTLKWRVTETIN